MAHGIGTSSSTGPGETELGELGQEGRGRVGGMEDIAVLRNRRHKDLSKGINQLRCKLDKNCNVAADLLATPSEPRVPPESVDFQTLMWRTQLGFAVLGKQFDAARVAIL
eukprot:6367654-Lingulodinium_polyedra.AAC.1